MVWILRHATAESPNHRTRRPFHYLDKRAVWRAVQRGVNYKRSMTVCSAGSYLYQSDQSGGGRLMTLGSGDGNEPPLLNRRLIMGMCLCRGSVLNLRALCVASFARPFHRTFSRTRPQIYRFRLFTSLEQTRIHRYILVSLLCTS